METIIDVRELKKSFASKKQVKEVLKGVNFTVRKGQIFSLLGSNGSGKTTTIRILSTLIKPDTSQVKICGYDLTKDAHKIRQCISLTGQFVAVDEMLTGYENMELISRFYHIKNYRNKIDQLLEKLELIQAAKELVKNYSGGMRRKLDLAMSLLGEPKIIFLDEPTTGLDPQSRLNLWETIEELKQRGTTIFLTTQYLEEAERLADYVAVLNNGVIVTSGTPRELKMSLKNIEVKEYEKEMPTLEEVFLSIIKKGTKDE